MKKHIFSRVLALTLGLGLSMPYGVSVQAQQADEDYTENEKAAEAYAPNDGIAIENPQSEDAEEQSAQSEEITEQDAQSENAVEEDVQNEGTTEEQPESMVEEQHAQLESVVEDDTQMERAAGNEIRVAHNNGELRELVESNRVKDGDVIVLEGFATVNSTSELGDAPFVIDKELTFRGESKDGKTPTMVIRLGGIILEKDVSFENLEISFSNRQRNVIMANGHTLRLHNVKRSSGAREVNLACGGLTNRPDAPQEGTNGEIILSGKVNVGNIYAGSIAHQDWDYSQPDLQEQDPPGEPNDFAGDATIRLNQLTNGSSVGDIYASGARQIPINSKNMFDQKEVPPPKANAERFKVSGDVNIYVDQSSVRNINGATGRSTNANLTLSTQYPVENLTLSHIGALTIQKGVFKPTMSAEDHSLENADVTVAENARLDMQLFANKRIGSLTGGGMIVLGESDTLHISGNVSGNTKIAIGGINNAGTQSSTVPKKGHAYITAQQSQNGAFTLIPHAAQMDMTFEKDAVGNWKVSEGGAVQEVKIQSVDVKPTHQLNKWDQYYDIPMKVAYADPNTEPSMENIPAEIKINDKVISKASTGDGYVYTSSTDNLRLQFTVIEDPDDSVQLIDALSCNIVTGYAFYEGTYKIEVTIPQEYTASGTPMTFTTTLNVINGEVQPPQPEDMDLKNANITLSQNSFVYNKGEHRPDVTVMVEGKKLEPEKYTVDYANNTNAGQATVTVTAVQGSGYTGSASTNFTIDKAQLALKTANIAAKTYDGTRDAVVTDVTFHDQNNAPVVLEAKKDYTVQAQFNDANVAAAQHVTVTADLTEQTKENYVLNTNTLTIAATITKDTIAPVEGNLAVTNHHKGSYTYDLMQLLTQLEGVKTYGNITFQIEGVNLGAYYTNGAAINGNTLTLPIVSVDTQKEGAVGTITVGIQTENYTVQHATIRVNAVNKLTLQGTPKLSDATLTYGDTLSKITLSGSMQDDGGKTVDGVFAWVNPQERPSAGNVSVQWKFTPNDTTAYQVATGQVTLTVQKATPKGTPKYTQITTSGKTLADAKMTAEGNVFDVAGSVKWVLPDTTEVKVNTAYEWIFTPNDTNNYNVLKGSIILYVVDGALEVKGTPKLSSTTLTYGDTLSKITLSGSMQDDSGKTVDGVFAWVNPQERPSAGNVSVQWKFTPNDTAAYQVATGQVTLTVQKATPKGTPKYTKITTSGKTLADAKMTAEGNVFDVAGSVKWVLPDTTEVKVNTAYEWIFTPNDTNNYNVLKGSIILYVVDGALEVKGTPKLSSTTLTYGDTLSKITLSGSMQDDSGKTVDGVFAWVNPQERPSAGSVSAQWKFTPNDTTAYQVATGQVTLTVQKATPKGTPKYTKITTSGKTLADAKMTAEDNVFDVAGSVKWVLPDTTEVKANTAYDWIFTPNDTNNYNVLKGSITPYTVSSGSGGGGNNHNKNHKNQSATNQEGATTTVENKKDGTVITTTKKQDGSIHKVEVRKDGTTTETNTTANGTTAQITEDADGKITEISGQVSDRDAQMANEKGKAVQIPIKVENASSTQKATGITIDVPKGGTRVEIPVNRLTFGTVAVMVHQDGTEEILKHTGLTESGITVPLGEDATIKVVDRSRQFQDVQNGDWHKKAVDFMSARELMHGTDSMQFSPKQTVSRGMLSTILYHLANDPTVTKQSTFTDVSENTWYADAIQWAAQAGVLSGHQDGSMKPNDNITREQLAVMLYRYAGAPTTTKNLNGFVDGKDTSEYAKTAIAWAVENGVMSGKGNGILDPKGLTTRAEAAQMVMNFINS